MQKNYNLLIGDSMKKNLLTYMILLGTVLLLLSACSSQKESAQKDAQEKMHVHHAENGDLRELTQSIETLPEFLNDKPEEMQMIYRAVPKYQELLESIPCYCGCGESAGHKDNYDCFVFENKETGEIVWDDHGTRCGVCLETAGESILKYNDGESIEEIRQYIDEKYKEGFAEPTPTQAPAKS